jgi:adenosylcobyric acid synthase|tara:strand:- start:10059 stop:10352 length:294 start_codon:yes stop_codon:yes gene_type:complete
MTTLMVQGTSSDSVKITVVAGLCRVLAGRSYSVAPFKPQNMALNGVVISSGWKIGMAQALQPAARYLPARIDMDKLPVDLGNATINNVVHDFTKITA